MWNLLLSGAMVGLPAGFGVYILVKRSDGDNPATAFMLILYAIVLGSLFAFGIPEGKLTSANFKLKMPAVILIGAVIGAIVGLKNRRRKS